jgi:hypothetical protein
MSRTRKVQTPGQTPTDAPDADLVDTAPETAAKEQAPEATGLPSAADIDPKSISKAVLTRDGWVCPA